MAQAYLEEGLTADAAFELFVRDTPPRRNFLLFAGLAPAVESLAAFTFDPSSLEYLDSLGLFRKSFLDYLARYRFRGALRSLPEGTPFFPGEPVLEVRGPLPDVQIVETVLMNRIHAHTVIASKAVRVVLAARADGRPRTVVDFGLRRAHGPSAGLALARSSYIAGAAGTSNLQAGRLLGIPVFGTMAHSYVQAHESEEEAFRAFARLYPGTTLLIDTYDTIRGLGRAIRAARAAGPGAVRAVRIDSGDLERLARRCRRELDAAGMSDVRIFASGGLDEDRIAELVRRGAPIDGFGVGTRLAVPQDAPAFEFAYKLVEYAGRPRRKLSSGKTTLPGRKQVFRTEDPGGRDVVELLEAAPPPAGRPLLEPVPLRPGAGPTLGEIRERVAREIARLPARLRSLEPADPPYEVELGPALAALAAGNGTP
ncbi:MAG: nicotinate phosphoribosyltransferase [Acidobacteria bacterium]|nr:MAG: nicotinate phosphoribosyltransferase [Acidobacteriota bacterium]